MDSSDVYFFSPTSVLVAVVTALFLFSQARPWLSKQKRNGQLTYTSTPNDEPSDPTVSKEPEIPEGWWKSREVFELERRALFSKSWLYLAHKSQFSKPGSYQSFNIAGFPIFLIKGKDHQIRAFHNVCRHRAYTITRKECGTSTVLGCRYHGWSYDTRGRLVKAPQFEDVAGFDKTQNSLFEIHTHTTEKGSVLVNLDAGENVVFEENVSLALGVFEKDPSVGMDNRWVTGKTLTGEFNWKLGINTQHQADVSAQLEKRVSEVSSPSLATTLARLAMQRNSQTHASVFPNTFLYSFRGSRLWLSMTFLPATETTTQVRYDLFTSSLKAEPGENDLSSAIEAVIQTRIAQLETGYQSIRAEEVKNPEGTSRILAHLHDHTKLERAHGAQVRPAMRQPKGSSLFQQAEQLCREIECSGPGLQASGLDW